jgi:hypothetical protein
MDPQTGAEPPRALNAWLPTLDRRSIVVCATLLVLLLAPWPGLGRAFAKAFCVYGNGLVLVAGTWDGEPPRFEVPGPAQIGAPGVGPWAVLLAGDRALPLDTRIIAYTPLAIFLALVLATPVPRPRRLVILTGGLACLLLRLAFAVLVPLDRAFGGARSGSTLEWLAEVGWTVFITPPVMSYATPLLVWWLGLALTTPRPVGDDKSSKKRSSEGRGSTRRAGRRATRRSRNG